MPEKVSSHAQLLSRAKAALHTTSEELGKVMGVSRRTMTRYWTSRLVLHPRYLKELAAAVVAVDRGLAEDLASAAKSDCERSLKSADFWPRTTGSG